ncbi:flagellar hook assembly protein FlgD [Xanthobacteraceae bacterium Astr-EGSB]|uniref:flagellar hook assembly protein FlgD n=1 Tax=Astrobacterium formosum TaxID=3069710 RepID=UPI0027B6EB59|nr:flagellar hook assembly protein FlgD [Xanthobacteraceae bacterium Astr-EGSB]
MEVTSATNTSNVPAAETRSSNTTSKSTVDYDTFLKLLIAQMRNQDPTNPTDTTEYMSQLAQFSQVEQAVKTNSKLDSLLSASALEQADGLIGRNLSFISTDGQSVSGKIASISIVSGGAIATLADGQSVYLDAGVTIS